MKKINPILLKKQPMLWQQAVHKAEHRGYSVRNISLQPLIKEVFEFKHHQSVLFDHLIIGANPFLNLMVLSSILNNVKLDDDVITIGIFFSNEIDNWGYHHFIKDDFWIDLSQKSTIKNNTLEDYINKNIYSKLLENVKIVLIDNNDLKVGECRLDNYINGYIVHIEEKESKSYIEFNSCMPKTIESENNIKDDIKEQIFKILEKNNHENIMKLNISVPTMMCSEREKASHIFLSKNIFLTSTPNNWITIDSKMNEDYTFFNHWLINKSFGTAKKNPNIFSALDEQVFDDINDVIKLDKF